MRRARLDREALRELFLGFAEATELEGLARHVVPPLASALGASVAILHREHTAGAEGGPAPIWNDVVGAYRPYLATCPLQHVKRAMRSRVGVITDLLDARALRSSPVFHECFAAYDCERQLVANVGAVAPGLAGSTILLFGRSRRQRAFGNEDVELVSAFVPALITALQRNDRLAALHAVVDHTGAAQIAFDENGRVLWQSRAAGLLLSDGVPDTLALAVRRLARLDGGAPLVARFGRDHTALLRRARTATGAPLVLATLDAGQPLSPAEAAQRYRLTRAETDVLDALACGYANTEIADHLRISRGTVRIHLSRIYAKLGVASRTQALVKVRRPAGGRS